MRATFRIDISVDFKLTWSQRENPDPARADSPTIISAMRGNLAGRFALALGLAGTVATLACGASPTSPTSPNPHQGGPPHPTYTGLVAWASPPYRSVKVV